MEFVPLQPQPEGLPHVPTPNHIVAMCRRAFGPSVHVASARQLSGGAFNTTFLIALDDRQVILRIAPAPTAKVSWDEQWLMRREQHIQPFFAALATLMPRTLLADFTHQLIDRDYLFQTYLAGERWDEIAEQFTVDEQLQLWEHFGRITKTIHSTVGASFGGPYPAPTFASWSETILYRLERATQAMIEAQFDVSDIQTVATSVRRQPARLDVIKQPRLLHGDLWLFNILVKREADGPIITGVLDADRAWWGDPLADWTMFVLAMAQQASDAHQYYTRFWQAYGEVEQTRESAFRQAVYAAMYIGTALVWARQHDDVETVQRGQHDLGAVVKRLHASISD